MDQSIRNVMTSDPCTIDAGKSVAYAAKMMRDEDVRVVAEERNPDHMTVREVASKQVVTIDPQQDPDEALRIMAKHQVRRLPAVQEDGRLVGVVAQANVAREGDDSRTGELVQEISQ
jgi:CBS domain-containing protein